MTDSPDELTDPTPAPLDDSAGTPLDTDAVDANEVLPDGIEDAQTDEAALDDALDDGALDDGALDDQADRNADLMRADDDPLPDAQVPGAGPDGQ